MASTLSKYVLSKYKNNIFIETGTLHGDGVKLALDCGFSKIYSIEIDDDLVEFNLRQFHDQQDRIQIIHGDSFEVLKTLLKTINEPATFWLDGHWDSGPLGMYNCPLLHELDVIYQHHIKSHSLLIDDRRLFGDSNHHWGREVTEEAILSKIKQINPLYYISYENGVIPNDIIGAKLL